MRNGLEAKSLDHVSLSHVAQSVTYLTGDSRLTADQEVAISTLDPVPYVEIDHEFFLRPISSPPLIQEGLLSVTSESMCTKYCLTTKSNLHREKKCG